MKKAKLKKTILMPITFAEPEKYQSAMDFGFWLAKTLRMDIHAIHVTPTFPLVPRSLVEFDLPVEVGIPNIQLIEEQLARILEKYTEDPLYEDVNVVRTIKTGDAANWVCAEAENAELIVLGSSRPKIGLLRHLSMAYRVLANTTVPVAVVPTECDFTLNKNVLSLMLADDLENHSKNAADFGFWIASQLKDAVVNHVYVTGMTQFSLQAAIDQSMASAYKANESRPDVDVVYKKIVQEFKKKLTDRTIGWAPQLELARTQYKPFVLSGYASYELAKFRNEMKPQMEFYGNHHTLHRKPFGFGRVPLEAMLDGNNVVFIVP